MLRLYKSIIPAAILVGVCMQVHAQTETKTDELKRYAVSLKREYDENRKKALSLAKQKGWATEVVLPNGGLMLLTGVTEHGYPEYTATDSNVGAAATTGASQLWPGGPLALNLTGSSSFMRDKLALWDGGRARGSHVELVNRVVHMDNASTDDDHATHVAGTLVASGINSIARGMAYQIPNIHSYNFSGDITEMANSGGVYLLSNHSYGAISGWRFNDGTWEFWGDFDATEDYKFGFYDSKSRVWDSLAFAAPNYLIVKSAGNNRNQNGPNAGATFKRYDANGQMTGAPAPYDGSLSRNDTYDIISTYGNAKNILTVGAVSILSDGYNGPSDVSISSFSSWGPSDDGRIKPEIVAAGVGLTSSIASSDNAYGTQSGTSMSAPNATGSLILLQEYFRKETERFMRSATLKALAIHTANEAGSHPGPDYVHGFGLLNVGKAAEVIKGRTSTHRILEENLEQGKTTSITMVASGSGPLVATICWTDPPAISDFANRLNNPTPKLINDLDIRIKQGATTFSPWRLNRLNPAAPATNGDNTVDNVEKIEINNPIPGETYTIEITHKGNLQNEAQAYSLILSGVGGTAYCTSQPSSNSDSRIDNFTFGGINRNGTGCTQYTNATSVTGAVFPGQSAPFSITLGSCGTNKDKVAKIYADWNNDGDFSDDGELLATSGVISGIGTFNGNIAIPGNLSLGTRTRLRVVVVETNDAGVVSPCGAYTGGGETQDYTLQVNRAEVDGVPLSVVLPVQDACSSNEAYVAVRVQNNGAATLNTLPVTTVVRNGNTVIATLKDTVRIPMTTGRAMTVYHKTPIATTPGVTYTFSVYTDIGNELNRKNDTITVARAIASLSAAVAGNGSGQVCSSGDARVSATITNGTGSIYWYTSSTGGNPIGSGNSFTTSNVPGNRTFYAGVNDASGTIGPPNKAAASLATSSGSPSGGYNTFSPAVKINVVTPLIIESARMYFGNHGRIVVSVVNESSGITVSQTTLDITATAAFATNEAQNNDLQDTGRIMPLNLLVPAAGNYLITVAYENGATVFRNNNISATPYPLNLPGLMSITGNTATTTSEAFYYYFYAMKVRAAGCVSSQPRLAVVANAPLTPTITQNGNTLRSSVTNGSFTWLLNGTVVPNATGNTLTISEGGNYRVQVNTGGCVFESPEFPAVLTAISNVDPAEIGLTLTPNPAKEKAEIRFSVKKPAQIALDLVDMSGKRIHAEQFAALPGSVINRTLSLEELPSGLYLVRVYFDNKQFVRRLMIAK